MRDDFANTHTHTHSSGFDGMGQEQEFFERAAELGQPALGITDHGTLRGLYHAAKAADSTGVKLLPGCELYMADNAELRGLTDEDKAQIKARHPNADEARAAMRVEEARRRDRDHVTVWALDDTGMRNLYRLASWAWGPGFYYKPRVDMARLRQYGEGLAITTGCPAGIVPSLLRQREYKLAHERMRELAEAFGDRCYVEIMPHRVEGSDQLVPQLVRLAEAYGMRLLATQDAHYPTVEDSVPQEVLLCVHTRDKMGNPDRFKFSTREFWLRSREDMREGYRTHQPGLPMGIMEQALDETLRLAERSMAKLQTAKVGTYLVAPPLPEGVPTYDHLLLQLCAAGVRDRYGVDLSRLGPEYRARLAHELRTIKQLGFASYFAMVYEMRTWARGAGIFCGPGRGSAAGSLVAYLLRITDLDPLVHGLLFERFLAPGRLDLPDVDLDYEAERREEVLDHLREQYGADHVGHISTVGTFGSRMALRDLARVYGIAEREVVPVIGTLTTPTTEEATAAEDEEEDLATVLGATQAGREFTERYPDVVRVASRLQGQQRSVGLHAAGVVISSVPLVDVVPVESRARKGGVRVPCVAFDMHGTEAMGLVKVDVLGLRTLTMLRRATELAGISTEEIPLEDEDTLEAFTAQRFGGVFQYDSPSARRACRGFRFSRFGDVAAITALDRPGPLRTGLAEQYVKRAMGEEDVPSLHPTYDRIFDDTYGVPVYQEQLVLLARELGGFTPEQADKFRKGISKKTGVEPYREPFVGGAVANGMDEGAAQELFATLVGFGGYAFNKCLDRSECVMVKTGSKRVGDLEIGDEILEAGCPGTRWGRVRNVYDAGSKPGVEIVFDDGSRVCCSWEHRFLGEDGQPVAAADLVQQGRTICQARGLGSSVRAGVQNQGGSNGASAGLRKVQGAEAGDQIGDDAGCEPGTWGNAAQGAVGHGQAHVRKAGDPAGQGGAVAQVAGGEPGDREPDLGQAAAGTGAGCAAAHQAGAGSAGFVPGAPGAGGAAGLGGLHQDGGFCGGGGAGGGGRAAALRSPERGGEHGSNAGVGSAAGGVGAGSQAQAVDQDLGGLFYQGFRACPVGAPDPGVAGSPSAWGYAVRRPVCYRSVASRPMVDIEVASPHYFVLANGLISHNSHAKAYALVAWWCMYLKAHYPAAFFAAYLATEPDQQKQMRVAGEARRAGIPVLPPDVNVSGAGFKLVDGPTGPVIVGSVADLKGVGPAATKAVVAAQPYKGLLDFYQRTAGKGGKITAATFAILARATALRQLCPHTKLLVENYRVVWEQLAKGLEPVITGPVPEYSAEEQVRVAAEVYPTFVDEGGRNLYDDTLQAVRSMATREILAPGEVDLSVAQHVVVLARVGAHKLFPGEDGTSTLNVLLADQDGTELVAKADHDVAAANVGVLDENGALVLVVLRITEHGRAMIEACWGAPKLEETAKGDPLLQYVLRPGRSVPRDPMRALLRAGEDEPFGVQGMILRVHRTKDRRGGGMLKATLLGSNGALRFLVFDSRLRGHEDVKRIKPGAQLDLRLYRLRGEAAALGDREVREVCTGTVSGA